MEAIAEAGALSQAAALGLSYTVNLAKLGVKEVEMQSAILNSCFRLWLPILLIATRLPIPCNYFTCRFT